MELIRTGSPPTRREDPCSEEWRVHLRKHHKLFSPPSTQTTAPAVAQMFILVSHLMADCHEHL